MKLIKYLALLCTPVALFSCGGNKKNYTVTFDLNGGYGDFPSQTVVEGTYVNDPGTPQHDNTREIRYAFDYWSCNGSKYEFHTVPITQDTTLKAEWKETTRIYHTVSFDTDGGEPTINPIEVEDGFTIDPPETVPIKAADKQYTYQFKEWQLNGARFEFDTTPITSDGITLKAKYTTTVNKYTVTFDSDGGTAVNPQSVEYGGYADEPDPAPTKPSTHDYKYDLEYWMDENENKFEFATTQIFDHTTLKAKWKPIARVYHTVSFDTDGGEPAINPVEVEDGFTIDPPETVPIKAADKQYTYQFKEWQLNGARFEFDTTPITSDGITLKAKYTTTVNKYTVTFDSDGGTAVNPQSVEYGGYADEPDPAPTKPSTHDYKYELEYWMDENEDKFEFTTTEIYDHITLKAKWKPTARVYHYVSFDTDGGTPTIDPVEVEDGFTIDPPETVPVKEKDAQYTYTFKEWQLNGTKFDFENTKITTDGIELKAYYDKTLRSYEVTFETCGGTTIEPQTVDYGGHATKPETDPIKQTELLNYPFVRWEDKDGNEFNFDNTEITGPTTIYAKWGTAVNWWLDDDYIAGLTEDDVGLTRGITVNSKIHSVRLIGIEDDTIANSNDKAHTTWEFATLFSNSNGNAECCSWERNGHYSHTSDDYVNSGMRKSIDGGGTADKTAWESKTQYNVLSKLPETLQSKLKTVTKYVNTQPSVGSSGVITSYNTSLFQLSLLEMGYYSSRAETTYVNKYDYYSDCDGTQSTKRIKYDCNGNASKMWLRSPYTTTGSYDIFNQGWIIKEYGGEVDDAYLVLSINVNYYAVAPAFCI